MPVEEHIYNDKFFENTIKLEADSAANFVKIILQHYSPKSLIDIGCGAGIYLKEFESRGINNLLGLDGSTSAGNKFLVDRTKLIIHDLAQPISFDNRFDLCLCLEVAEHLRPEDADGLIRTLTDASDQIVFTAATPGQGPRSIGHINEQPHEYWIDRFKAFGYEYNQQLSEIMRKEMELDGVVWWIVNNLMLFSKKLD